MILLFSKWEQGAFECYTIYDIVTKLLSLYLTTHCITPAAEVMPEYRIYRIVNTIPHFKSNKAFEDRESFSNMQAVSFLLVIIFATFFPPLQRESSCQGILKEHRLSGKAMEQRRDPRGECRSSVNSCAIFL